VRALITGGFGKVGRHAAAAFRDRGHSVTLSDIVTGGYGPQPVGTLPYIRADLTDYGQTIGLVMKAQPDVIVHAAGIPDGGHDPASVVFANNSVANFNVVEAVARTGVRRLIYLSSETAAGYVSTEYPSTPDYLPVDEDHPVRPRDAYALSKALGEQICASLVRRCDATAVSVRPSLVLDADGYRNIVPRFQRQPRVGRINCWSYVDVLDLADLLVLVAEADTAGHEIVYAAQPDNLTGRPLEELVRASYDEHETPDVRPFGRVDSSGISSAKATEMFGWQPRRSWRDHLEPTST
jgi:UDP-glucose 4-epimerase